MATLVAVVAGFVGVGYASLQAQDQIADALALAAGEGGQADLRAALDLMAQQRMAWAAIAAVGLSGLSAALLAGTVWFTLDASRQSQESAKVAREALNEARLTSRRELMPHVVGEISVTYNDLPYDFSLEVIVSNFGRTPCYLKNVQVAQKFITEKPSTTYTVFSAGKILEPNGQFQGRAEFLCADNLLDTKLTLRIIVDDIFYNNRNYYREYDVSIKDYGTTVSVVPVRSSNPLRSLVSTTDGKLQTPEQAYF